MLLTLDSPFLTLSLDTSPEAAVALVALIVAILAYRLARYAINAGV